MQKTFKLSILLLILPFLFISCQGGVSQAATGALTPNALSATPDLTNTIPTFTPIITFTPLPPTATLPPTQTPTPTLIPTPTWAVVGPGEVIAPILMYHEIDPEGISPRYNTTPEVFAEQMQALDDWGYHTITAAQLTQAITEGAPLPEHPVVITFDDGHYSVYQYAFPIMQEHGFFGVTYIVANRLKAHGFLGAPQLKEMIEAGWEVGSHSYTHANLTLDHTQAFNEIYYSREDISEAIGVPVTSFAYPYGAFDFYLGDRTPKWGYTNAMGLGGLWTNNENTLFYLERIEVQGGITMEEFANLLPWSAPPEDGN